MLLKITISGKFFKVYSPQILPVPAVFERSGMWFELCPVRFTCNVIQRMASYIPLHLGSSYGRQPYPQVWLDLRPLVFGSSVPRAMAASAPLQCGLSYCSSDSAAW